MPAFDPSCIDVDDFLECLDIRNVSKATAQEMRFSCPFPGHLNGDERASAYMNIETTAFFCHGCKEKGNAVNFTADYLGVSPIEATKMLRERYQPGFINPDARNTADEVRKILAAKKLDEEKPQPLLPEEALERFEVDWYAVEKARKNGDDVPAEFTYMLDRGFDSETLTEWQFGFDEHTNRITLAVRDMNNRLVGFKARAWDDRHPKYLILGDRAGRRAHYGWPCYQPSKVIFGLYNAVRMEDPGLSDVARTLIVCEGELNAIALQMHGWPGVAVNGSNFSQTQANLLRHEADLAVVFFDSLKRNERGELVPDEAGRDGTKLVVDALKPFIPVKVVGEHEGDPASMSTDEIASLIEGAMGATAAQIKGLV